MGYSGEYYRVLIAFLLVYAFASIIAWAIYRYLGFIVQKNN
jgi:acyltransferase